MTAIELSLENPCPGMRRHIHRLVDRREAPRQERVRSHLRRCKACRSYVEQLHLQDHFLLEDGFFEPHDGAGAKLRRFSAKQFERWLSSELSRKSESHLIDELCLLGRGALLLDPDVSASLVAVNGGVDRLGFQDSLDRVAVRISTETLVRDSHLQSVAKVCDRAGDVMTEPGAIARHVLRTIESIVRKRRWEERYFQAVYERSYGDSGRIGPLLRKSLEGRCSPTQIAQSLHNLAMWRFERGHVDKALSDARYAVEAVPSFVATHVLRIVWLACLNRTREAAVSARAMRQFCSEKAIAESTSVVDVLGRVQFLGSLLSHDERDQKRASNSAVRLVLDVDWCTHES